MNRRIYYLFKYEGAFPREWLVEQLSENNGKFVYYTIVGLGNDRSVPRSYPFI